MRFISLAVVVVFGCSHKSPPPKPPDPRPATLEVVSVKDRGDKHVEVRVRGITKDGKPVRPIDIDYEILSGGEKGCEGAAQTTYDKDAADVIVAVIGVDYCGVSHADEITLHLKAPGEGESRVTVDKVIPTPPAVRATPEDLALEKRAAEAGQASADATVKAVHDRMTWLASLAPVVPDPARVKTASPCPPAVTTRMLPTIDYALLAGPFAKLDGEVAWATYTHFTFLDGKPFVALLTARIGHTEMQDRVDPTTLDLGDPPPVLAVIRTAKRAAPEPQPDGKTFSPGVLDGIVAVIDTKQKRLLCAAPLSATSSQDVSWKPNTPEARAPLDDDFHRNFATALDGAYDAMLVAK